MKKKNNKNAKPKKSTNWTRELFLSLVAISIGILLHFIKFHLNHSKIFNKIASKQPLNLQLKGLDFKSLNLESINFPKFYSFQNTETSETKKALIQQSWSCPFDLKQVEIDPSAIKPKYQLNPDKFLLGIFPFGPSNQFHGFRDTVLMAIFLNRTLILPKFFKHRSDPTSNPLDIVHQMQDITEKIDLYELQKFISVRYFEDLKNLNLCGNVLDTIVNARLGGGGAQISRLKGYQYCA